MRKDVEQVKVLLSGCNGRMGRAVAEICAGTPGVEVAAGFDLLGAGDRDFPVFSSPAGYGGPGDVVVDFSSPAALETLLEFGRARRIPLVLATTGYSAGQLEQIETAAAQIPIFRSGNMSLGVNVLLELVVRHRDRGAPPQPQGGRPQRHRPHAGQRGGLLPALRAGVRL